MSNHTLLKLAIGAVALTQACAAAQAAAPTCATTSNITLAVTPTVTNTFTDIISDFALANSANYTSACYTVTLVSAPGASIKSDIVTASGNSAYDILVTESVLIPAQLAREYSG